MALSHSEQTRRMGLFDVSMSWGARRQAFWVRERVSVQMSRFSDSCGLTIHRAGWSARAGCAQPRRAAVPYTSRPLGG